MTLCVAADLGALMNDAIYPAKYLAYFTGYGPNTPLNTPIIEAASPTLQGLTQQTLWGAILSYTNSQNVCSFYLLVDVQYSHVNHALDFFSLPALSPGNITTHYSLHLPGMDRI